MFVNALMHIHACASPHKPAALLEEHLGAFRQYTLRISLPGRLDGIPACFDQFPGVRVTPVLSYDTGTILTDVRVTGMQGYQSTTGNAKCQGSVQ